MPDNTDLFREFGVLPYVVSAPAGPVRCSLSWARAILQSIEIGLLFSMGLAAAVSSALVLKPFPINLLLGQAAVLFLFIGCLIYYVVIPNDYGWVELDGNVLRARHLYTRRLIERPIEEIADLLTIIRPPWEVGVAARLGRIRGIKIRFRNGRTPIRILRGMRNARELIEAIIFRMKRVAPIDTEVIILDGKPLIRRIFWKEMLPITAPTHPPTSQQYRLEGRLQGPGRENA